MDETEKGCPSNRPKVTSALRQAALTPSKALRHHSPGITATLYPTHLSPELSGLRCMVGQGEGEVPP